MKKNELYLRIMKDHGIDPQTKANANRLVYDIPHLEMGKKSKSRTPVTQIFNEVMSEKGDQDNQKNGKHTV